MPASFKREKSKEKTLNPLASNLDTERGFNSGDRTFDEEVIKIWLFPLFHLSMN
jgi:hypothetical protein